MRSRQTPAYKRAVAALWSRRRMQGRKMREWLDAPALALNQTEHGTDAANPKCA